MRPRLPLLLATAFAAGACGLGTAGLRQEDAGSAVVLPDASIPDATIGAIDAGADTGVDATEPVDAALQDATDAAPPIDGGPCLGLACNGACLDDASDCRACPGSPLLCAATRACGATCAGCTGSPIQCFDCDSNRQNPVGTCQPQDTNVYCLAGGKYPDYHCGCGTKNDPTSCPGQMQVCGNIDVFTIACMTCGESGTDGLACRGGGACHEDTATCQ